MATCRATTPKPSATSSRSWSPPKSLSAPRTSADGPDDHQGRDRTRSRRRYRRARGRARRRRLLARRADRRADGPRHPGPRRARRQQTHGHPTGLERRPLRVHAPRPASDTGAGLYRKRQQIIQPVFADTNFNRRIDRFQRRGRSAARSEWRLITASGNLMKLHRHQLRLAAA
ncbi:MAG: transposase [Actinobacteria bacterium]|nr:transposase [Actinomycetota bacterium]